MRFPLSIVLVVAAASQVAATDCGQITRDQGFDLWCGETLCSWKVERGTIARVGTWHEDDAGVEMIGDDVAFEQLTPVNSYDTTCIRFELISNVAETAEVRLNVDVFGDGTIDYSERIPTSNWKPVSFLIPIQPPYNGVRFEMAKRGNGKAVVAQLQAEVAKQAECAGLTPIVPTPASIGALCETDAACGSHLCRYVDDPGSAFGESRQCVGCDPARPTAICAANQVCGFGVPPTSVSHVPVLCVARGADALGEQCLVDGECASGVCNGLVCSTCSATTPCTGGEQCGPAHDNGPSLCSPNGHVRLANEPCASNADCASAHCIGPERKQCADGRPCSSPAQCPVEDDLAPGECLPSGIQGGRCE